MFITLLWWFFLIYLIYVFIFNLLNFDFSQAFFYDGEAEDRFKIKNIAYSFILISVLNFFKYKKYIIFLPSILLVFLDVINGSRTIAFIALVPVMLTICFYRKTLFIIPGLFLLCLLLLLGVLRSDNIVSGVPWYLNAIGEFRETYITLPLFISNPEYVGQGTIFHLISAVGVGVLYFFRMDILEQYVFAGQSIALIINRGYGLGSNIIIEGAYYGYLFMLLTLFLLPFILFCLKKIIDKSTIPVAIVIASVSVIFLRLVFREGLYTSLGALFLIGIFYILPLFMLRNVVFKYDR
ncbi:hypothetical protein [Shewanella sp. Koi 1]